MKYQIVRQNFETENNAEISVNKRKRGVNMLNICSLFQTFFGFVKRINKKLYRTSAVIFTSVGILSIVCLSAKDFGGSGKNHLSPASENGNAQAEESEKNDDLNTDEIAEESRLEAEVDENNHLSASVQGKEMELVQANAEVENAVTDAGTQENLTDAGMQTTQAESLQSETTQEQSVQVQTESAQTETVETQPETQPETTQPETQQPTEPVMTYQAVDMEISENDYYWLTRIVEAEAGDQDDIGKILVVNVILNRVRSGQFPDRIKSVIFQNNGKTYQFEPVKNGRIYDMNPTENTIQCVDRALNGEDYSNGALYFTMKTSSRSWFNTSLTLLFVHGDHYFYTD